MQGGATITRPRYDPSMAKKKAADEETPIASGTPVNFRAPADLYSRLKAVAGSLGLDVSNLVRMVLYENLSQYERRASQLREDKP